MEPTGKIFIISSPSGGGKTTLCNILRERMPELEYSISITTRSPRKNEVPGKDYMFVSGKEFEQKMKNNDFLEWAMVHGHRYGTSKTQVLKIINTGKNIVLDIDVQGAMQIKKIFPESVLIFITVPSIEILRERLKRRHSDDDKEIARRVKIAEEEMGYIDKYNYCILNDDLEKAAEKLVKIVRKAIEN
jgi:guanylate kinase